MKILMLHGINHNMFGKRDPKQYGTITLAQIDDKLRSLGKELQRGVMVDFYYADGKDYQPSDAEVKKLRPASAQ